MKYANRAKYKLHRIFKITYISVNGLHHEYVKTQNELTAHQYADKQAKANGAVLANLKISQIPKYLNNDEKFTNLI